MRQHHRLVHYVYSGIDDQFYVSDPDLPLLRRTHHLLLAVNLKTPAGALFGRDQTCPLPGLTSFNILFEVTLDKPGVGSGYLAYFFEHPAVLRQDLVLQAFRQ